MKILCKEKVPGGKKIKLDGIDYHFKPNDKGHHVAEIDNKDHVQNLKTIGGYVVYNPLAVEAEEAEAAKQAVADSTPVEDEYDAMSKDELAAEIEKRTGKAPHPNTAEKTMRAALRELDDEDG